MWVSNRGAGVDIVLHAAGFVYVGWSRANVHHAINVEGTKNVAVGALAAGARYVYAKKLPQ